MATHCSVLEWRIPGTAEPGGLPSMRSHRIGHDGSDLAAAGAAAAAVVPDTGIKPRNSVSQMCFDIVLIPHPLHCYQHHYELFIDTEDNIIHLPRCRSRFLLSCIVSRTLYPKRWGKWLVGVGMASE